MSAPTVGATISDITLPMTSDKTFTLSDYRGKNVVIYFYPKDSTPGCTTEGQGFRDMIGDFEKANTVIFGVSRDSLRRHENFKEKQSFPFELISDEEEALCKQFDVIKEKNMYGKKYMGIERSTFLFSSSGELAQEWRKVKVKGHVEEVLAAAQGL